MLPNLLQTMVASSSLPLVQSGEFANVRNWRTKEKESEMYFIWVDDSVRWKLSESVVTIEAIPTTFAITLKTDIRV